MTRRMSLAILVAAALGFCAQTAAAAETVFPAVGDVGDHSTELRCPPGQYVVGINGRWGLWIDQIQIVCATVHPVSTENDTTFYMANGPSYTSPALGGPGGGPSAAPARTAAWWWVSTGS